MSRGLHLDRRLRDDGLHFTPPSRFDNTFLQDIIYHLLKAAFYSITQLTFNIIPALIDFLVISFQQRKTAQILKLPFEEPIFS